MRCPPTPTRAAFGVTRTVGVTTPMIAFEHGQYSVPHTLVGQTVWVRPHGDQVVVVHVGDDGPVEVARHARTTPGNPRVEDAHFPPQPQGPLGRTPRARTVAEARFLALGDGAVLWLTEAAAAGCPRIRVKMAEAVDLAALHDPARWTAPSGRPRPRAGSATATWPRCWPIGPAAPTAGTADPANTTAWPRAPAAGPASARREAE